MKIEISGISAIEARAKSPFSPRTLLISIGDTDAAPPKLEHKPDHILRLVFDDITLAEVKEEFKLPDWAVESDEKLIELLRQHNTYLFDDEMADQAAHFVIEHMGKADLLICQCHYGQSRSAGLAAAIAEHFYGSGIDIFADDRYYPNKLVYRKMRSALKAYEKSL